MTISRAGLFAVVAFVGLSQVAQAQQKGGSGKGEVDLRQAISTLTEQVKALAEKQELIVAQLKDLKQMLEGSQSGSPAAQPPSTIPVRGEAFRGDKTARLAVIEFGDFECPICGKFAHDIYPQILENYVKTGKVRYFYRDLALVQHTHVIPAARAAHCAGEQGKFWEMFDNLLSNQTALEPKDIAGNTGLALQTAICLLNVQTASARILSSRKSGVRKAPSYLRTFPFDYVKHGCRDSHRSQLFILDWT